MTASALKENLLSSVKEAMKARDKQLLGTLRLMQAELKRVEVDERIVLDDARVIAIFDRMLKQRRDSAAQYTAAGRAELAAQEEFEIGVIQRFMPQPLSQEALDGMIRQAIASAGASGVQAMGAVMAQLKPQVQGRADMAQVSQRVKALLAG
jgi:uncharacterized protein YqeY